MAAAALPRLHSVPEVAEALGQTERYVREKARLREWPHRRLARNEVRFSDEDFAAVLELIRAEATDAPEPRLALAPRSAARRIA
jgi:hypothetical protein